MRRILSIIALAIAGVLGVAACSGVGGIAAQHKANNQESKAQGQDQYNLVTNQPVPVYQFSQMRATEIDVQDIQANGEDTTSFFFNQGVQDPIMSCVSRGMPVPASAQLTNPLQVETTTVPYQGGAAVTTGQMDPTGVYTGDTTGTNVLCLDQNGNEYIQYWEGFVDAVSGHATWDAKTHTVKMLGKPDPLKASSKLK